MRLDFTRLKERRAERHRRRIARLAWAHGTWRPWFAWRPVRLCDKPVYVWLTWIERKGGWGFFSPECLVYDYREKEAAHAV